MCNGLFCVYKRMFGFGWLKSLRTQGPSLGLGRVSQPQNRNYQVSFGSGWWVMSPSQKFESSSRGLKRDHVPGRVERMASWDHSHLFWICSGKKKLKLKFWSTTQRVHARCLFMYIKQGICISYILHEKYMYVTCQKKKKNACKHIFKNN